MISLVHGIIKKKKKKKLNRKTGLPGTKGSGVGEIGTG